MIFRILADTTVVIHLGFILFVILGGVLVARWPWVALAHLPAVVWSAWVELAGWECPLTPLENWFRQQAGVAAYHASFVEHYLIPILYPSWLSREIQWGLGGFVLLINATMYFIVLRRGAGRQHRDRISRRISKVQ